jgi:tetrahydromethanopterin S-methyltransferase subunit H
MAISDRCGIGSVDVSVMRVSAEKAMEWRVALAMKSSFGPKVMITSGSQVSQWLFRDLKM